MCVVGRHACLFSTCLNKHSFPRCRCFQGLALSQMGTICCEARTEIQSPAPHGTPSSPACLKLSVSPVFFCHILYLKRWWRSAQARSSEVDAFELQCFQDSAFCKIMYGSCHERRPQMQRIFNARTFCCRYSSMLLTTSRNISQRTGSLESSHAKYSVISDECLSSRDA